MTAIRSDDNAALAVCRRNGWQLLDKRQNGLIRFVDRTTGIGKDNDDDNAVEGGEKEVTRSGTHVR